MTQMKTPEPNPPNQTTTKPFDFSTFPTLNTQRLHLRQIVPGDAHAIFKLRSDYEVTKYNIGPAYTRLSQAQRLVKSVSDAYNNHRELRWAIALRTDLTLIGMVGFNYWDRIDNRGSIGFDLRRDYWRRGIMREAVTAVLDFAFTRMALNRIEADTSSHNAASVGLLQNLGFQQEGIQREQYLENGTYHDLRLFALLKREWQKNLDTFN